MSIKNDSCGVHLVCLPPSWYCPSPPPHPSARACCLVLSVPSDISRPASSAAQTSIQASGDQQGISPLTSYQFLQASTGPPRAAAIMTCHASCCRGWGNAALSADRSSVIPSHAALCCVVVLAATTTNLTRSTTTALLCTAVRSSRIFFLRPHPVQRCLSGPTSPVIGLQQRL